LGDLAAGGGRQELDLPVVGVRRRELTLLPLEPVLSDQE
jgi:hypothetical protein